MIQVTENVYVETGFRGCNLGFVTTKQGIVVVDTPMYPTDALKWREEISKKGPVRIAVFPFNFIIVFPSRFPSMFKQLSLEL